MISQNTPASEASSAGASRRKRAVLAMLLLPCFWSCSNNFVSPTLVSATVLTATTLEPTFTGSVAAGYTAYAQEIGTSSNRLERTIPPNGFVTFTELGDGFTIEFGIEDLPAGCTTSAPRRARDFPDGEQFEFYITCS